MVPLAWRAEGQERAQVRGQEAHCTHTHRASTKCADGAGDAHLEESFSGRGVDIPDSGMRDGGDAGRLQSETQDTTRSTRKQDDMQSNLNGSTDRNH